MIGPDVLNMLIESDSRTRRYDNSKISKILGKLNYIYETLLDHKDESNYNPLEKGKGSIYNDAKSIV